VKVPYVGLVSKFGKLEADLSMLNSTINHDEIAIAKHDVLEKVEANQSKTVKNFEALKTRFIGPNMAKFYATAMKLRRHNLRSSRILGRCRQGHFG
jgi:hypothetical protein